ncbi:MAG: transglycosylase SLT domain-containing protein [Mariprofundus sp.]|nr:transglycosylase SLT domain-containing protein [Mariprofundus sp.]
MMNRYLYILITLATFLLASCAPLKNADNTSHPETDITEKQTINPFLAGLTEQELESIKVEAKRVYVSNWERIANRSRYVRQPLVQALKQSNAPMELEMIPVVESSYNPYARSEVGATGLWQLMPGTATDLRIKSNSQIDGRRDIATSTRGAARFLLKQYERFGSWPLAFAAYHLGPNGVQRRIDRHPWHHSDGLNKLPLPPITKTYIRHILGLIALQQEGVISFPAPYPTTTVTIHSPVDLERLHATAGLPKNQLFRFNPQLVHMQYFKDRPKNLSLRISQTRLDRINHIIPSRASDKLSIRVLHGEQIKDISKHYRVSVYTLKKANPKLAKGIRHGMRLHIPIKNLTRARIADNPLIKPEPKTLAGNTVHRG